MTTSNLPGLPSSWKDQIQNNTNSDTLITNAVDILIDITPAKSPEDLKSLISQEEELYVLIKSNSNNTCPLLLHHAKVAKGSTQNGGLDSETLILHQGLEAHAIPFVVDPDQLFSIIQDIPKPSYDPFFTANSAADLDAIDPIDENAVADDCRQGLIIPHFIAKLFIEQDPPSAKSLLLLVANYLHALDDVFYVPDPDDDTVPDENKIETFRQIFTWLLNFEDKIPATILTPLFQNTTAYTEDSRFQRGYIVASPQANPIIQPLPNRNDIGIQESSLALQTSIANNIERFANTFEKNDPKSKSFEKFPNLIKSALLSFATTDLLNPAEKLGDEGLEIMKQKNDTDAHALLINTLKSNGIYFASLSIANAKEICCGRWPRANANTPSGLSVLLIQSYDPASSHSRAREAMVLRLKTKHSMDEDSIAKLLDTDITLPQNFEGMMENIKVVSGIISCFAPNSYPDQCYQAIIKNLMKIEKDCKRMINDDEKFITKILSDIDNRTSRILEDCTMYGESKFANINFPFLNMKDIPEDIIAGKYSFSAIPHCIKSFSPSSSDSQIQPEQPRSNKNRDDRNNRQDGQNRNKKQRTEDLGQRVVNHNQHPRFKLKQGENYNIFNNKDFMHFIDRMFCKRWHFKGYCTYNCNRNHEQDANKMPRRTFDGALNYMTQCRLCVPVVG